MSQPATYTKVTLASYAVGVPKEDNFAFVEAPIPTLNDLKDGEVLLRALYLSVDPYMRWRIREDSGVPLGSVMIGNAICEVAASKHAQFKAGDVVNNFTGWTEYAVVDGNTIDSTQRVDASLGISLASFNGVVGMPGLTAYFGLVKILEVEKDSNKTLLVTGAAGAVGATACQLGKLWGLRVIAIAGSDEKVSYLKSLGVDVALNYKSATFDADIDSALKSSGYDYFFENVGGSVSDALIPRINPRGRVALCGQIAMYNATTKEELTQPRFLHTLIYKGVRIEGFVVSTYFAEFGAAMKEVTGLVKDGKLKVKNDIMEGGIRKAPSAFFKLFTGENFGKQSVHIAKSQFGYE